jgi:SAM-dependent methyltransferase
MKYTVHQIIQAVREKIRQRLLNFGSFRKAQPFNENFGLGLGLPVDRYYIETFLQKQAGDIKGRVLEIGGRDYTQQFGTGVNESKALTHKADPDASSETHIIGDLANCPQIPNNTFDCIILTQTLHYMPDMTSAVKELWRILAPSGVLLCTVPCISQISRFDMDHWGDRWRLTSLGLEELLLTSFEREHVQVSAFGNALSAVAFIEGVPAQRLRTHELDARVADFEVMVCGRAQKL